MSVPSRVAAPFVAAALALIVSPPAFGASGIYGGTTSKDEAIVLTTDAKAQKLRSAVIVWVAPCEDGMRMHLPSALTATTGETGFSADPTELVLTRNARGRFAGRQVAGLDLGDHVASVIVTLSGKLRKASASGKLAATVSILDKASMQEVTTCRTATNWSASRSAGRIYGGKTSQSEPVVVRLDRNRKRVTDLLVGWESDSCEPPDRYFRFGEDFGSFAIRGRAFGDTFTQSYPLDDGGKIGYGYDVKGSVAKRSASGSLTVNVTVADAAGTTTVACNSGPISWRAATG